MDNNTKAEAYDNTMGALGHLYKVLGEINAELLSQTEAMQEALNDDYADELCGRISVFINRMNMFRSDIIEVQRALDRRMTELFS